MDVMEMVGAAGALGTASFGFVEALKGTTAIGTLGLGPVNRLVDGDASIRRALSDVYGAQALDTVIEQSFRRGTAELSLLLKNGLRISLSKHAATLGTAFGQDGAELAAAIERLQAGSAGEQDGTESQAAIDRATLGRYEIAVDARVDAAVCASQESFASWMRLCASFVAIPTGAYVGHEIADVGIWQGLLVGALAVPIAPIARDLTALLTTARSALRRGPAP